MRLDADVAAYFTTDESVNEALRLVLRARDIAPPPAPPPAPARSARPARRPAERLPHGPRPRLVRPFLEPAGPGDVSAVVTLRNAVADELSAAHGAGPWSRRTSADVVARDMKASMLLVAHEGNDAVATLRLATRKPWAIDLRYFTPRARPLYLHDMAVAPTHQRRGIGRRCIEDVVACALDLQAGAIRLDAFDAEAGAGVFYAKCGFQEVGRVACRGVPLVYFERALL